MDKPGWPGLIHPPEERCTECKGSGAVPRSGVGLVPCPACEGTGDRVMQVTNALAQAEDRYVFTAEQAARQVGKSLDKLARR